MNETAWKIRNVMLGSQWERAKGELRSVLVIYGHGELERGEYEKLERQIEGFITRLDEGILS